MLASQKSSAVIKRFIMSYHSIFNTRALCLLILASVLPSLGLAVDCNNNSKEDELEIISGDAEDCNANGIPDECDLIPSHYKFNPDSLEVELVKGGMVSVGDFDGDKWEDFCDGRSSVFSSHHRH